MFSANNYPNLIATCRTVAEDVNRLLRPYVLQCYFLIEVDICNKEYRIIASNDIPIEPFNGTEKSYIDDVLKECFNKHPKAHIHNIKQYALPARMHKFNQNINGANRMWFLPFCNSNVNFIFLGFPRHDSSETKIPQDLSRSLSQILISHVYLNQLEKIKSRLAITELCSKEIGHDISSSVQAVLAKARSITQYRVEGDAIQRRAKEIEFEIMAIYRHSESLGIAVDRNYHVRDWNDLDGVDIVNNVKDYYISEAEERHIIIKLDVKFSSVPLFGDQRALENALGQLVLNAIKYAHGHTTININIVNEGDYVRFEVVNVGIPLPNNKRDQEKLWEFGERSKEAKERHVNGSGIGLYTCKKIILAHEGTIFWRAGKPIVFGFRVPLKQWLRKTYGDEYFMKRFPK